MLSDLQNAQTKLRQINLQARKFIERYITILILRHSDDDTKEYDIVALGLAFKNVPTNGAKCKDGTVNGLFAFVSWEYSGKPFNASASSAVISLYIRIIFKWLNNRDSDSFPFHEALWNFKAGKVVFRAASTVDKRENKANVRSESADGIPQFLRYEEICGRLPASPPTESVSGI